MSIPIPFLTQKVELYQLEAEALRDGLDRFIHQLLFNTGSLSIEQAYALKPVAKVQKRLLAMGGPLRPWAAGKARKVRLEFDELLALRRLNGTIQAVNASIEGDDAHLVAALGKVQQKALVLDPYIKLIGP